MNGYVIVNLTSGCFYNGMNQWKRDIRDAKIYHTTKGAQETINYKFNDHKDVTIKMIEIKLL